MIKTEYLRFTQTLCDEDTSSDVKKIANIVLEHLDSLIPLTTAHGKRINEIVRLAQASWVST